MTDFYKLWYERYTTEGHLNLIFNLYN